ncbi:hypothetical protein [Paraliomyxa miuraensis]|uniref:hypothetical protein n=1 Tax=Paraliomyxa miuraensis TaxID=376150 RepID=UPI0022534606|nr:hypothetical protein [Paraliomyxa miuraensis]MCX4246344.1 hypothetical protein [Paraliomyxa miuraensis]
MMSARSPRARIGLVVAIAGPALALGGVWPWVIPAFAVVAGLLHRVHGRGRRLRVPSGLGLGLLAFGATVVQVLPLPGAREVLAPELHAWVELALVGVDEAPWPSLSPVPVDTALEALRLLALCGLALCCAQRSWRTTARVVAVTGVIVSVVGLCQHGLGIERIYGIYEARHLGPGRGTAALLTTFVNPNHQSGLLLLGIFATAGLYESHRRIDRRMEPRVVLGIGLLVQVAALVLSMSRAALLVGAVVGGVGLAIAWWPQAWRQRAGWARGWVDRGRWVPRLVGLATIGGVVAGLLALGAWHELATLWGPLDHATAMRLRIDASAPALIELAPITGIGRGAFGDVFPAFDPEPSHVWHSHLECAPLAMIVEWGPWVGGVLVVGMAAWWLGAMRRAGDHEDARARRIALLGLLAIAAQGLADFSLEHLGVAAPAVALAGALAPSGRRSVVARPLRVGAVVLAGLAVAAVPVLPGSWGWLATESGTELAREVGEKALVRRALHAPLHRARARAALERGDAMGADRRARAAVRLQPGHPDGWLLLAGAAAARGDRGAERRATASALARLHVGVEQALVEHLVERFPEPMELAALAPSEPGAWAHLVEGLLVHAPRHAEAIAGARAVRDPGDPEPLRVRTEAALALDRPGLALHHARLWRQLEPREARAHLAVVRALQAHSTPRATAVREALERALDEADLQDPRLRGMMEEQLLRELLRAGDPDDHARMRQLATALRSRAADDDTRRRRIELLQALPLR